MMTRTQIPFTMEIKTQMSDGLLQEHKQFIMLEMKQTLVSSAEGKDPYTVGMTQGQDTCGARQMQSVVQQRHWLGLSMRCSCPQSAGKERSSIARGSSGI